MSAHTFMHEMTHVMQYQNGQEVVLRGMALHTTRDNGR
jgi:hypothetical protein